MGLLDYQPHLRRLESITILQMYVVQRQHFLLSYLRTPSVGPAGVQTCDFTHGSPVPTGRLNQPPLMKSKIVWC